MAAKIIVTILWTIVLVVANKLLSEVEWAQYVVTFVLAGAYALLIGKVGNQPAFSSRSRR